MADQMTTEQVGKPLRELHPKLEGSLARGVVTFDCPCGCGHKQRIPVHAASPAVIDGARHWQASGEFPDTITLTPSIDASASGCWHGFVTNGKVA